MENRLCRWASTIVNEESGVPVVIIKCGLLTIPNKCFAKAVHPDKITAYEMAEVGFKVQQVEKLCYKPEKVS